MIEIGSDFSGIGAFDFSCDRVFGRENIKNVFVCDMDKFARQAYLANHEAPDYYPENVYNRDIPEKSLDIYMTSPPCQSFSIAGKRKGKDSVNGVLFFNSHEFIQKNKPKHFIFENVKGLLSDDGGKTFGEWIRLLGGKSVNGLPVIFPDDDSVPYHIYWKVLNSKKHGVPQNRERVFIIGIREDEDNVFTWPKEEHLTKHLKDVLETDVDPKYFLSDKMVEGLLKNGIDTDHLIPGDVSNALRCGGRSSLSKKHSFDMIKIIGNTNPSGGGMNGNVFDSDYIAPTLSTNKGEGIKIKSATKKGYETATIDDSINFSVPNSETRKGRGGKSVAQTLDTQCNQAVWSADYRYDEGLRIRKGDASLCVTTGEPIYTNEPQIRRLTPRECLRLQDFPESFKIVCSDSQTYKQAGNSITVRVLELLLTKLNIKY